MVNAQFPSANVTPGHHHLGVTSVTAGRTSAPPRECFRTVSISHSLEIERISPHLGNENPKVTRSGSVMSCCPVSGTSPETINPRVREERRTTLAFVLEHHSPTSRLELA